MNCVKRRTFGACQRRIAAAILVCCLLVGGLSCAPRAMVPAAGKNEAAKVDYNRIPPAVDQMLPAIRRHVSAISAFGSRQTGQSGCDLTLQYVQTNMNEIGPQWQFREFTGTVAVALNRTSSDQLDSVEEPFSHVLAEGLSGGSQTVCWPAYAFAPNCVQPCVTHAPENCPDAADPAALSTNACRKCELPRRVVDLGSGSWDDLEGKDPDGAIVLLDFNSGDAWLRAAGLGAVGALFIEPDSTTVYQADRKYLATLPLDFPRMYLRKENGLQLRESLKNGQGGLVRVTMKNRLSFRNVPARCMQWTIPGTNRNHCFVLTANVDARSVVPDLSYGAAETWGIAELLEVSRYFVANQPACDIEILFVSGHWQSQQPMRDDLAYGGPRFDRLGTYYRIAMGLDLEPDGTGVNLLTEASWDVDYRSAYHWLGQRLFGKGGWRDQIFEGLDLPEDQRELFGGTRPTMAETQEDGMADRNNRSPLIYTPRYRTAEEAWQANGLTSFAFQSCRLSRLTHFTPLDRFVSPPGAEVDAQLRPQLQVTLAVLHHILNYPADMLPSCLPSLRKTKTWGGYAQLSGRTLLWDRNIGWFAERLPGADAGRKVNGGDAKPVMQTFIQAYPTDRWTMKAVGNRLRNFLHWPLAPGRGQHRELQCFMFQDLRLLERPDFCIKTVYASNPDVNYNIVGYSMDAYGRLRYATDYGIHGDGNNAFQCTDRPLDTWDLHVPVTLFECGTLELLGLVDPQRYNPNSEVYGSWFQTYANNSVDRGMSPYLRITGVKDVQSHTDMEHFGFTQYGPSAMVFLPQGFSGAEVLLGSYFSNFAVMNKLPGTTNTDAGIRLRPGETARLAGSRHLTPLACPEALAELDGKRMAEFARYDVASPVARSRFAESASALKAGNEARGKGMWKTAIGNYLRGWNSQSEAYRRIMALLIDVVSTTVLYFVLLIPFSFLVERLVFPQRTVFRTAMVSTGVFVIFAGILYQFHPGFKLAHNVIVTITAFIVVVMTIPALILLLLRGVAMLKAIGSKAIITQQSEAESAGVVTAALSLAVSNMRRRRLRTTLTLGTITLLVVALVLLTTSSAFDFTILQPSWASDASIQGLQVLNARDHRQPLLKEMVEQYEGVLAGETNSPFVLRREFINYGVDHQRANCTMYLNAGPRRAPVPFFQVMDWRDNLVEYMLPDDSSRNRKRTIHLSDLVTGEFLAQGDVDACLLPNNIAEALGVKAGDTVTLMGLPLKVKGTWAARERQTGSNAMIPGPLDRFVGLDGQPLTVTDGAKYREGEPEAPIRAPSSSMVILPRAWVEKYGIFPSCVYSLLIVPGGPSGAASSTFGAEVGALARRLAREILNVDVYTYYIDNVTGKPHAERLAMQTATRVQGSALMLVILVAAVLMIVAIMTGTVYERMREIHIFSSVGLSPRHVAGMFLVEALVYAGIAAVLGYFIGIIALKGVMAYLKATGSQQEFYPNYLGVFVLYSTGVAVIATVASSIYPIRLASRIVNPSEGKAWSFEPIDEDGRVVVPAGVDADAETHERFLVRLPFIATTWDEARVLMTYACDWLAMHQGERSGRFVCERPPRGSTEGKTVRLVVPVWLSPFERNLTQDVELCCSLTASKEWWELSLRLRRVSGPPYLWRRGATVFVNILSRHLLRWRAASPDQEADCLARFDSLFPEAK